MIEQNMARPEGDELTPESVSEGINVPPELQEAYERVVIAGMKVMFDQATHNLMLKELQKGGPLGQRLGMGVAGLLLLLFKESNETMPPQIIIPAGVELLMQAVDFLRKTEMEQVTNKDIGDGIEVMITVVLGKFGVAPDQLEQMLNQYDNTQVDAAAAQMGGAA
jgi:hypothetical protein